MRIGAIFQHPYFSSDYELNGRTIMRIGHKSLFEKIRTKRLLPFLLPFTLAYIGDISAGIIYEQAPPENTFGGNNEFTLPDTWGAEDFTINAPYTVESLSFWASSRATGSSEDLGGSNWRIYNDSDNKPNTLIASGLVTGNSYNREQVWSEQAPSGFIAEYLYTLDIDDTPLDPGTYWVAFHADPDSDNFAPGPHWYNQQTILGPQPGNESTWLSTDNGDTWTVPYPSSPQTLAFRVEGTLVPLPPTFWLMGSGFIALFSLKRRN